MKNSSRQSLSLALRSARRAGSGSRRRRRRDRIERPRLVLAVLELPFLVRGQWLTERGQRRPCRVRPSHSGRRAACDSVEPAASRPVGSKGRIACSCPSIPVQGSSPLMLRNATSMCRPALRGTGKAMEQERMTHLHDLAALGNARVIDELTQNRFACSCRCRCDRSIEGRVAGEVRSLPVSAADEAANRVIIEGLSRLLPGVPIVSEEDTEREGPSTPSACFALVDPLDGTREFLAGRDEFTVNIAVVIDATPVVGLIAAPALGLVWRGIVGRGTERLHLPTDQATALTTPASGSLA